jgi:nitrogen-specific signal transduction histidine kinase
MNVLLVLAEEGALRDALRAALPDVQLLLFEASVEAAGRRLVAMQADAILLDDAPGLGAAALPALRAAAPGTPVVVLSSRGDLVTQAGYLRAGARDVIVKPFAYETLRDTLGHAQPVAPAGAQAALPASVHPTRDAALGQHQMALRWLGRAARHAGDPDRLSHSLVESACDMFDAVRCAVLLEQDRHVAVAACHGISGSIGASLRLAYTTGMMRYFDERATLLDRATAAEHPAALQELQLLNGELAAPLLRDGRVFGAIVLGEKASGGAYTSAERDLLSLLARSVSIVFEQGARQAAATAAPLAAETLQALPLGVAHVGPDATITHLNPAGALLLGLDAAEYVGRSVQKLGSAFADVVLRAQRGGESPVQGRIRDMAVNTELQVDVSRLPDGAAVAVFQPAPGRAAAPGDVTESPFWEYLASRVAQEIKNPMVAINTFAQLLPRKYDSEDFRDAYSRVVQREIARINGVVETLFEFARDPKLSMRRVDLNATLEGVIQAFEAEFSSRAIRLETSWDPEVAEAEVDPDYLAQAVQNVVQNAIDAMPEGGTLRVRTQKVANGTSIRIEDTGPGMAGTGGEAFLPFYSTKEQGMGLGLPLANRIVERHRGALRLLEPEKPGNRVEIHLPTLEKAHANDTRD